MATRRTDAPYIDNGEMEYPLIGEWQGLTTDTKPALTDDNNGSTFLELNATTQEVETLYIYNDPNWYEV